MREWMKTDLYTIYSGNLNWVDFYYHHNVKYRGRYLLSLGLMLTLHSRPRTQTVRFQFVGIEGLYSDRDPGWTSFVGANVDGTKGVWAGINGLWALKVETWSVSSSHYNQELSSEFLNLQETKKS